LAKNRLSILEKVDSLKEIFDKNNTILANLSENDKDLLNENSYFL